MTKTNCTNKCNIEKGDALAFGSGGSSAIIIISKDNTVYKLFTLFFAANSKNIKDEMKHQNNLVMNEININKILTSEIIDKNLSQHFVKYVTHYTCNDIQQLFKDCPKTYTSFLKKPPNNNLCRMYFRSYPNQLIQQQYVVLKMEHCNASCSMYLEYISTLPLKELKLCLDILFFQIIYTIAVTRHIFPYFAHRDLFIRNILGNKEENNKNIYIYKYNNKTYEIPQKYFFPKINDFGMTNLNHDFSDTKLYSSEYKDIYNFILDVYNGGNLGEASMLTLCNNNKRKINFIKTYFNTFFNVKIIDTYMKKSRENIVWDWDNILDETYAKSLKIKTPNVLLNGYFYNIFGASNN